MIPAVICVFLSFCQPAGLKGTAQIIYMFVTYNLSITLCYTMLSVAHMSMLGLMTMNQKSRGVAGGMHMIGANVIGSLLVNSFFLKMSKAFGGGDVYTQKGFALTVAVYLALYVVMTGIAFFLVRERVNAVHEKTKDSDKEPQATSGVGTGKLLKSLVSNKYWVLCVGMCTLVYFLMGASSSGTIYYCQYVIGNIDMQPLLTSIYTLSMLPALFITIGFVGKLGKRNTLLLGMAISAFGWLLPIVSQSTIVLIIGALGRGIGFGIGGVPTGSIIQDALTYGLWKNGYNAVGMGNAANSFSCKIGMALGTVVMGFLLDIGNFDSTLAVQSATSLTSIKIIFTWLPGLVCIAIILLAFFYDLDKKYVAIETDIKAGNIGEHRSNINS